MLENSLSSITENWALSLNLSADQRDRLVRFFKYKDVGDYIYPSTIKALINVEIKLIYRLMDELKEAGYLKTIYEVCCSTCQKSKGIYLETLAGYDEIETGRWAGMN